VQTRRLAESFEPLNSSYRFWHQSYTRAKPCSIHFFSVKSSNITGRERVKLIQSKLDMWRQAP